MAPSIQASKVVSPKSGGLPQLYRWFGLHQSEARAGYFFVSPSVILIAVFTVIPMLVGLALGFYRWDIFGSVTPVGLENYRLLIKDQVFLASVRNTFYFSFIAAPLSIIIGLVLALLINEPWVKGKTFFSTTLFIPVIMSMISVALIWRLVYDNEFGILNSFLRMIGLPRQMWIQSARWAVPAIILVSVWKAFGYNMVIYIAALQDIPKQLLEASAIDGASRLQQIRYIVMPLLHPTTLFVGVISYIRSFQVFDIVYVFVGERGPDKNVISIVYDVYITAFRNYEMGYASAQAVVLFAIIVILTLFIFGIFSKQID